MVLEHEGEDGESWQLLGQAVGQFGTSRTWVPPAGQRIGKLVPHSSEELCVKDCVGLLSLESPFEVMELRTIKTYLVEVK